MDEFALFWEIASCGKNRTKKKEKRHIRIVGEGCLQKRESEFVVVVINILQFTRFFCIWVKVDYIYVLINILMENLSKMCQSQTLVVDWVLLLSGKLLKNTYKLKTMEKIKCR